MTWRMAASASVPADSMPARARSSGSASRRAAMRAAWAWMTMPVMWWAAASCSSRARSRRSPRRTASSAARWRTSRKPEPQPGRHGDAPARREPGAALPAKDPERMKIGSCSTAHGQAPPPRWPRPAGPAAPGPPSRPAPAGPGPRRRPAAPAGARARRRARRRRHGQARRAARGRGRARAAGPPRRPRARRQVEQPAAVMAAMWYASRARTPASTTPRTALAAARAAAARRPHPPGQPLARRFMPSGYAAGPAAADRPKVRLPPARTVRPADAGATRAGTVIRMRSGSTAWSQASRRRAPHDMEDAA